MGPNNKPKRGAPTPELLACCGDMLSSGASCQPQNDGKPATRPGGMTLGWASGLGPASYDFGPGSVEVNNMTHAPGTDAARQFFYKKNKCGPVQGVSDYGAGFGLNGLWNAGLNPTQQFVGNYRIDISLNGNGSATFTLTNTTSMTSFLYGHGSSWDRSKNIPTPGGNVTEHFHWTEPIPPSVGHDCGCN
jgi:hypothetical protein